MSKLASALADRASDTGGGRSQDERLATVITCTNFFYLPDYSSYEVAEKYIVCTVREAQIASHLSLRDGKDISALVVLLMLVLLGRLCDFTKPQLLKMDINTN